MNKYLLCCFALLFGQCALAALSATTPTKDFIDNGNGTVTHKKTGLIWQRCAVGQTWTGTTCLGKTETYTWAEALDLTSNLVGQSDWRLPNIVELQTIIERNASIPTINSEVFPNTDESIPFWSSSPYAYDSGNAWVVNFNNGHGFNTSKNNSTSVRLVRAGRWSFASLPLTTPTRDFVLNINGTATHKRTKLIWQRCAVGQTWTGTSCSGPAEHYTYEQAKKLRSNFAGKNDWRLPTENELLSIVESGVATTARNAFANATNARPVANVSMT